MKNFSRGGEKRRNVEISGRGGEVDHSKHNDPPIYQRDGSWNNARVERDIMNPDRKECLFVTVGDRSDRFFLPPLSIHGQLVFIPCLEIAARARAFSSGAICIERRHSIKDNEETSSERKEGRERNIESTSLKRDLSQIENLHRFSSTVFNRRFNETE